MLIKKYCVVSILTGLLTYSGIAAADTPIQLINTKYGNKHIQLEKIKKIINENFNTDQYKQIKVQAIYNNKLHPDHFIVYFLNKNEHGMMLASINIDSYYRLTSIKKNYKPTSADIDQQPGKKLNEASCPDPSVEFVAFAPVDNELEQDITMDVVRTAKKHGLKTISLLLNNATRENYLNYLVCPQLKGNFYDGNSNPFMISTVDGFITADEIKTILANQFRYRVTNIWVAGEAFEDPMQSALIDYAQAQKFAAGDTPLVIGPSDRTAACTMKAAINGKSILVSLSYCYKIFGIESEHWSLGGYGSDYFGQE